MNEEPQKFDTGGVLAPDFTLNKGVEFTNFPECGDYRNACVAAVNHARALRAEQNANPLAPAVLDDIQVISAEIANAVGKLQTKHGLTDPNKQAVILTLLAQLQLDVAAAANPNAHPYWAMQWITTLMRLELGRAVIGGTDEYASKLDDDARAHEVRHAFKHNLDKVPPIGAVMAAVYCDDAEWEKLSSDDEADTGRQEMILEVLAQAVMAAYKRGTPGSELIARIESMRGAADKLEPPAKERAHEVLNDLVAMIQKFDASGIDPSGVHTIEGNPKDLDAAVEMTVQGILKQARADGKDFVDKVDVDKLRVRIREILTGKHGGMATINLEEILRDDAMGGDSEFALKF